MEENASKDIIGLINNTNIKSRITQKKSYGVSSIKEIVYKYSFELKADEILCDVPSDAKLAIMVSIPVFKK